MVDEHRFRCGDLVKHVPSEEEWIVAYADYDTGRLSWCGWPEGIAEISDCTLVRAADDYQHARAVHQWARSGPSSDHRRRAIARLYPEQWSAVAATPAAPETGGTK